MEHDPVNHNHNVLRYGAKYDRLDKFFYMFADDVLPVLPFSFLGLHTLE